MPNHALSLELAVNEKRVAKTVVSRCLQNIDTITETVLTAEYFYFKVAASERPRILPTVRTTKQHVDSGCVQDVGCKSLPWKGKYQIQRLMRRAI